MTMNRLFCGFEVKYGAADDGSFNGYGSVFGKIDSYRDTVAPGAFTKTIAEAKASGQWPEMLFKHGLDGGLPVGVWTEIKEDSTGLHMEWQLALNTQRGADLYALMKMQPRPAINGLSIGYRAKDFTMGTKGSPERRTLKAVDLFEVSLVTNPADQFARIASIKMGEDIETVRDFENFLRDVGQFSNAAAKAIAASGFKAKSNLRDEDDEDKELLALFERATKLFSNKG